MDDNYIADDIFGPKIQEKLEASASIKIDSGAGMNFLSSFWYLLLSPTLTFVTTCLPMLLISKIRYSYAIEKMMFDFSINSTVYEKLHQNDKELQQLKAELQKS